MADLLSILSLSANGMSAQNAGIAVTSNNVSNANTQGYSRESVNFQELPNTTTNVGGVLAGSAQRTSSSLLDAQIQVQAGASSMSQAYSTGLDSIQSQLANSGSTIDEQLGSFFSAIQQASASPTDSDLRTGVVSAAQNLTSTIQQDASALSSARTEADQQIQSDVSSASSLAQQLAAVNAAAADGDPTALDTRDQLANQLAQLVGGSTEIEPNGQMRYVLDGGAVLVDGTQAATLKTTPDSTTGMSDIEVVNGSDSRDVTSDIAGGSVGGELQLRDGTLATAAGQLDQLAYDITNSVNTVSSANAALDGTTGHNVFTPLTSVTGAASSMSVDSSLAGNSNLLALAAPGAGSGDSTGAQQLFALSNQNVATGGTQTLEDAALGVVSTVASAAATATADVTRNTALTQNLTALQTSISGVDTNEELTNLSKFENTSDALVHVVSSVDDMLSTLITDL